MILAGKVLGLSILREDTWSLLDTACRIPGLPRPRMILEDKASAESPFGDTLSRAGIWSTKSEDQ